MRRATEFTLRSIELRDHQTLHKCTVVKALEAPGSVKLVVKVEPPIPGHLYDESGDLDQVVIAPRHEGATLVPHVSEWPFHVHICVPEVGGNWETGPFRSADWGVLERS